MIAPQAAHKLLTTKDKVIVFALATLTLTALTLENTWLWRFSFAALVFSSIKDARIFEFIPIEQVNRRVLVSQILLICLFMPMFLIFHPMVFQDVLMILSIAMFLTIPLINFILSKIPRLRKYWLRLVYLLFILSYLISGLFFCVNEIYDFKGTQRFGAIVHKREGVGIKNFLFVGPWGEIHENNTIFVLGNNAKNLKPGQQIIVERGRGLFGFSWRKAVLLPTVMEESTLEFVAPLKSPDVVSAISKKPSDLQQALRIAAWAFFLMFIIVIRVLINIQCPKCSCWYLRWRKECPQCFWISLSSHHK